MILLLSCIDCKLDQKIQCATVEDRTEATNRWRFEHFGHRYDIQEREDTLRELDNKESLTRPNKGPEFFKDRDRALLSLNKNQIIAFCIKYGIFMPKDMNTNFWVEVHRARVMAVTLPEKAREESRQWLIKRGMTLSQ